MSIKKLGKNEVEESTYIQFSRSADATGEGRLLDSDTVYVRFPDGISSDKIAKMQTYLNKQADKVAEECLNMDFSTLLKKALERCGERYEFVYGGSEISVDI